MDVHATGIFTFATAQISGTEGPPTKVYFLYEFAILTYFAQAHGDLGTCFNKAFTSRRVVDQDNSDPGAGKGTSVLQRLEKQYSWCCTNFTLLVQWLQQCLPPLAYSNFNKYAAHRLVSGFNVKITPLKIAFYRFKVKIYYIKTQ